VRRIENNYVLPDMVAKVIQGMPVKRVMEWGQDQVAQAVRGQLKASG
jgi:glycyl-tRNA synthetase beta subunit